MTNEQALVELATSTADAVRAVLETFSGQTVEAGGVSVVPRGTDPLANMAFPAVLTHVGYVDGVKGGNVFAISVEGARKLATTMMGGSLDDDADGALSELAMSAIGEAGNQMLASAAAATSEVLGEEIEIDPPQTAQYDSSEDAAKALEASTNVSVASFSLLGEPCRLVQLVPQSFVVRMQEAFQERAAEISMDDEAAGPASPEVLMPADWLWDLDLTVSAELGRTRVPVASAAGLGSGALVHLDRRANDPVDLYVNGRHFGRGRLLLDDEGEWAVRIEDLQPTSTN
ncbi:MAG: FliM/FliN family flagellar motor switch protein [Thermoleophilaceae bacterium]